MAPAAPACPICGKPVEDRSHRPFCSARCKRVDLGRWFGEAYRVPVEDEDDETAANEPE